MNSSFLYGFLAGCLVTIIVPYCMKKIGVDNEGSRESARNSKEALDALFLQHPDFMNALTSDINNPEYANIREFLVVDKHAILNASIPRFRYELSEAILPALSALEKLGYIQPFKNNCLHYKMMEAFVMQMQTSPNDCDFNLRHIR